MISHEEHVSLLEFLYRKSGVILPESAESPGSLERLMRDVFDDLQRSQNQLRDQVATLETRNRELGAFSHMVAHDLKDPLTVMVATADLITSIPDMTPEELKKCLRQIRSTAHEMNNIVNNLLRFALVSKMDAPVGSVDMARAVANVQDRLSYMVRERRAQIILPEAWPLAIGYGPWIEEVWANYLSNALKYGGQPPRVELGASAQPDGMVRFWTRDNGLGIPPATQEGLFTPFSQINRVWNRGHGLGLSMVLQIVEKLGGRVGVESEMGKGSLFFFTLPAPSL